MAEALALLKSVAVDEGMLDLVRRARKGDVDAFDDLVLRHQRRVLKLAYQMVGNAADAQDVAQDVFIRLWKYLGRLRDETKFSTWLYRMVVNASYDLLGRRRPRSEQVSLDDPGAGPAGVLDLPDEQRIAADREVEAIDLKDKVLAALAVLTPSERTVFVLKEVEGLEVREIALVHESSPITVRRHLSTARHKMRGVLGRLHPDFARKGETRS